MNNLSLEIYTDGSCLKNPGVGATAAVFILENKETGAKSIFSHSQAYKHTTNNRMEMLSVIFAVQILEDFSKFKEQITIHQDQGNLEDLQLFKLPNAKIHFYSDSNYTVQGILSWMSGWLKSKKLRPTTDINEEYTYYETILKNPDLWNILYHLDRKYKLNIEWVKGHADNEYNNLSDEVARNNAIGQNNIIEDINYITYY